MIHVIYHCLSLFSVEVCFHANCILSADYEINVDDDDDNDDDDAYDGRTGQKDGHRRERKKSKEKRFSLKVTEVTVSVNRSKRTFLLVR